MSNILNNVKRFRKEIYETKKCKAFSVRYFQKRKEWSELEGNKGKNLSNFEKEHGLTAKEQSNISRLKVSEVRMQEIARDINMEYSDMIKVDFQLKMAVLRENLKKTRFRIYFVSTIAMFCFSIITMVQPTGIAAIFALISAMAMLYSDCNFWPYELRQKTKNKKSKSKNTGFWVKYECITQKMIKGFMFFLVSFFVIVLVIAPQALI